MIMRLTTKRLLLRAFRETDFAALHAISSDPEVLRYRSAEPHTEEMTRNFLRLAVRVSAQQPRFWYPFAVVVAAEERLVGECGLTVRKSDTRAASLWYALNRADWGRGYMTEAAAAVVEFGFTALGLREIGALCHPDNMASRGVLEKIGMRRLAYAPERNRLVYSLERDNKVDPRHLYGAWGL